MNIITFTILLNYALLVTTETNNEIEDIEKFFVTRRQLVFDHHELTEEDFLKYSALSDMQHLQTTAEKLAIPRVVGSQGHGKVRQYIVQSLEELSWSVELDNFHAHTPIFGELHFQNIIAKLNPHAERYLMLACHYDSKYFANEEFVGATDSAVPCAMLLNLAHALREPLEQLNDRHISIMLVFFDGEEAFVEWNDKDSIYGAKHLAETWQSNGFLEHIDMLMLLDLIGMPDPKFYSFFSNTENWYSRLLDIEDRLADFGFMQRYANSGIVPRDNNRYFQPQALRSSYVEDDHIPFLKRGVPVLHLITMPFPEVWHKPTDNITVIDFLTTENIARIIRLFTLEYLKSES